MFTTTDIQRRLEELESERMLASLAGLSTDPGYMSHLRSEIDATRDAYVGAAVTEIASLRGQLSGPLYG
jgi:D-serine deaminase-like pyridoxal phosphate-dependent protein